MNQKWTVFVLAVFLSALLAAVAACAHQGSDSHNLHFEGLILTRGTALITGANGNETIEPLDLIVVTAPQDQLPPPAGSLVSYTIRPEIMESYPPRAEAIYVEIVAEKAGPVTTTLETALRIKEHQPQDTILLDVRTPEEFALGHIPDAINYPLSQLRAGLPPYDKNTTLIVYCKSGVRTIEAAQLLDEAGFKIVLNAGGIQSYEGKTVS